MTAYTKAEADVEFGGIDEVLVGSWGSFWKKIGRGIKAVFTGAAKSGALKEAVNAYVPGAGDALEKGIQLVEAGKAGSPEAVAQIKQIADAAKAGDKAKQSAHDMLTTINDARNEAKAELGVIAAVVGKKKYVVKLPDGTKKSFNSEAEARAFQKSQQAKRRPGQQRKPGQPQQRKPSGQRPVTQQNVAQAMQRVPAQNRQQFAQTMQQMQLQGYAPVAPMGQPVYGQPGYPYGMQAGQPYGYGLPQGYQNPYGGAYYSESYLDQGDYYGDEELAAAFSGDESFPDDGIQGENAITYQG
jgi:hypothetical protein